MYRISLIYFLFQQKYKVYKNIYFNNIYILITPTCFDTFVSSSVYSSKIRQQYYKSATQEKVVYIQYHNIITTDYIRPN